MAVTLSVVYGLGTWYTTYLTHGIQFLINSRLN
jgi:hypothetical protein